MGPTRGVYILANDRTFDLTIAFLNSFRLKNPSLPLCLIPFDDQCSRIKALASTYDFCVYQHADLLSKCDRWGAQYHGRIWGHYRKLVAWWGMFDEFVYVDTDTIILQSVDFVFDFLVEFDIVAGNSNIPWTKKWVWKSGTAPSADLSQRDLDFSANTGFIASKAGLFSIAQAELLVRNGLAHKHCMELNCYEQPLLNYVLVKTTQRYSSLQKLALERPEDYIPGESWAGDPKWKHSLNGESFYCGKRKDVLFIHWSGEWLPNNYKRRISLLLNFFGMGRRLDIRKNMPNSEIWNHFRDNRTFISEPSKSIINVSVS